MAWLSISTSGAGVVRPTLSLRQHAGCDLLQVLAGDLANPPLPEGRFEVAG